jgi:FkbM family methyltransferase
VNRLGLTLSALLLRWYFGPDHPAKLRLWELVWRMLGRPRLTIPYAENACLAVDLHDYVDHTIIREGFYEPEVWEQLSDFVVEDEVFWDIGGHIGSVSIRAAEHPGIRTVHAFEPNPKTHQALALNLHLNPDLPVTAHPLALSNRRETRSLRPGSADNTGQARLTDADRIDPDVNTSVSVRCDTVDHLVRSGALPPPTLVKLDVEGWEGEVLAGAEWTLANHLPRAIVFEGNPDTLANSKTLRILKRYDYGVERLARSSQERLTVENFVATPR